MWFNFFKHKKEVNEPKTFDGRFISDEEIMEMVRPKGESFVKKELTEINSMMNRVRNYFE